MPRPASLAYRCHKATGQGFVRFQGRFVYFGAFDSPESRRKYMAFIARQTGAEQRGTVRRDARLSVGELAQRYHAWMSAERGEKNSKVISARCTGLELCRQHAGLAADEFGPAALQTVQQRMLADGVLSRTGINRRVRDIVAIYRWGVSQELVPAAAWQALSTVRPIRFGQGRENAPRMPADSNAVESVIGHLRKRGSVGAARLVLFLRSTGCRPGEAFNATASDLRLTQSPPVLVVRHHKCEHLGMERAVVLNAAAEAVVREALSDCTRTDQPLFLNTIGNAFDKDSLRLAVDRACDAAEVERFTPYQLRHLAATEAVNRTGSEAAAAALLGHSPDSKLIRRYSRGRVTLAVQAAKAVGA